MLFSLSIFECFSVLYIIDNWQINLQNILVANTVVFDDVDVAHTVPLHILCWRLAIAYSVATRDDALLHQVYIKAYFAFIDWINTAMKIACELKPSSPCNNNNSANILYFESLNYKTYSNHTVWTYVACM